jgi:hypothetical protein
MSGWRPLGAAASGQLRRAEQPRPVASRRRLGPTALRRLSGVGSVEEGSRGRRCPGWRWREGGTHPWRRRGEARHRSGVGVG